MISQEELEAAIAGWKARQRGEEPVAAGGAGYEAQAASAHVVEAAVAEGEVAEAYVAEADVAEGPVDVEALSEAADVAVDVGEPALGEAVMVDDDAATPQPVADHYPPTEDVDGTGAFDASESTQEGEAVVPEAAYPSGTDLPAYEDPDAAPGAPAEPMYDPAALDQSAADYQAQMEQAGQLGNEEPTVVPSAEDAARYAWQDDDENDPQR